MNVTTSLHSASQAQSPLRPPPSSPCLHGAWFASDEPRDMSDPSGAMAQGGLSRSAPAAAHVLVVEDDALIALDIEQMLLDLGDLIVTVVHDVASALAVLERERPDVGVLDVELGGQDSAPIAERLAAAGKPFVFLTGYQSSHMARLRGALVLEKPFSAEALGAIVRKLLNRP
ncbi:MAG: two-component response regulator [Hyphomicrobiales bacterium]|nr:two-component response regulator [Hyphomicrobiales bacterium]